MKELLLGAFLPVSIALTSCNQYHEYLYPSDHCNSEICPLDVACDNCNDDDDDYEV